jgi:N-terminal domain of reverse transcriptase
MTAQAGATLNQSSAWKALNWQAIEGEVRRLQARIVKAVQQGRWNKAKALQHLLTRSASGKFLAARRVTEKRREENSWRRQGDLGYAPEEAGRSIVADGAGISSSAVAANLYS